MPEHYPPHYIVHMKNTYKLLSCCFVALCLFISGNVFGQGESNIWYFGAHAGLDFNAGAAPNLLTNGAIDNSSVEGEGCSAISTAAGVLLFYTDGVTIYNRNHVAMGNGTGLMGDKSSTQTAIIEPVPGNANQYYVFTSPVTNGTNQIRYSIVDMTLNTGLGGVTATKNVVMPSCATFMMEALTSVPTNVPGDFWIIGHDAPARSMGATANTFYAWKVTSGGIASTPVTSSLGYALPSPLVSGSYVSQGQGFLKSNTCFNKIFASYFAQGAAGRVEMFDFTKSSGIVSGVPVVISNFDNNFEVYGIEISPNSQYLYVTELGQTSSSPGDERIHQFDLLAGSQAAVNASRYTLMSACPTNFSRTGELQLAPNGKIYVSHHSFSGVNGQLGVINNPDVGGVGCTYQNAPAALAYPAGTGTTHGLPQFPRNFVASSLNAYTSATSLCHGSTAVTANLSYTFSGSASTTLWTTTGGGTFSPSNSDVAPTVSYTTAGTKNITLSITDACGNPYTDNLTIVVTDNVNAAGSVSCSPNTGTVTSPAGGTTYVWYSDAAYTNAIATGTPASLPIGGSGSVYLRAESSATPTTTTPVIRAGGTPTGNGGIFTVPFTLTNPITVSNFKWANKVIYSGAAAHSITVSIKDAAGTTTLWSYTQSVTNAYVITTYTTPAIGVTLPAGNYQVTFNDIGSTDFGNYVNVVSDANMSFTNNADFVKDFNYSVTTYAITARTCAVGSGAITYNCPLPVTWLGFTANRSDASTVLLNWATATEQNTALYEVQRSLDGVNFETIGQLNAAGNSSSVKTYDYTDFNAPAGNVYYRLLQKDIDGVFDYSKIVYVNGSGALSLSLVPNPGNGSFTIIGLSADTKLEVAVYSITGQSLYTTATYPGQLIDLGDLAKGFYVVRIRSGNSEQSIRYINQ